MSSLNEILSSSSRFSLPTEILSQIAQHLKESNSPESVVSCMRASKWLNGIFSPFLSCQRLVLQEDTASRYLDGIIFGPTSSFYETYPSDLPGLSALYKFRAASRPRKSYLFPYHLPDLKRETSDSNTIQRKAKVFGTCSHITLMDIDSAETIIDAYYFVGEDLGLWKNVQTLCIGPGLLWQLGYWKDDDRSKHILSELMDILKPSHLCFTYTIGPKEAFFEEIGAIRHGISPNGDLGDEFWENHFLQASSTIVEMLVGAWDPKDVTIHNITAENLPTLGGPPIRFFWGETSPREGSEVLHKFHCNGIWAGEIADNIAMSSRGEEVEFVDPKCPSCENWYIPDDKVVGGMKGNVWRRIPDWVGRELEDCIRFVGREDAEPCACCGMK